MNESPRLDAELMKSSARKRRTESVVLKNSMTGFTRKRSTLHFPITMSVALIVINTTLMVCWIVLLAIGRNFSMLTIGTILFVLTLIGLSLYLAFSIKEVRLNQRQSNFVDSVTHELKSPIASLKLYLETLLMRDVDETRRREFYRTMQEDVFRLDHLINQLLEVSRLDELGSQEPPVEAPLEPLLTSCARSAAARYKVDFNGTFKLQVEPGLAAIGRPLLLEIVFGNLIDNAVKYSMPEPKIEIVAGRRGSSRASVKIIDNGAGVPATERGKIFQIFYRGGNELERRTRGTGLGLYIVKTLLGNMKGKIAVHARPNAKGSVFEAELPGNLVR